MNALAGQSVLKSLDLLVNGKLSFSGANLLEKGALENSSLNDLRVFVHGELPGNWHTVVENLRLAKKALGTCAFHPNTWVKVADNQMAHFSPVVIEEGLGPKQQLTVNVWGELSCEGTEELCKVLVRSPLSSLTLNFYGKLSDGVADCFARCFKPHKTLSSVTINIWGELTMEGRTVFQRLSGNNLIVRIKVHDVRVVPDESNNFLKVSIDSSASLKPVFSKAKETRKEKLSLTINNQSGAIKDWAQHLGDALAANTSLTALDLTIHNYMMNPDVGEGLGESILRSTLLTSFSLTINNYNNMAEPWDCILGDGLSKMASLTTLSLAINDHSEGSIFEGKGLSDSLIAIKSLSTLCIVINSDDTSKFWTNVLPYCLEGNTSLKNLCLTVNKHWYFDCFSLLLSHLGRFMATTTSLNELTLTTDCVGDIFELGLSDNKSLTALTVTVNVYQDVYSKDLMRALSDRLAKNNSVTTLTLTVNDYSEGGKDWVYLLLEDGYLSVYTSLTTLNLTVNSCGKVHRDALPDSYKVSITNSSLTTLRLQVNNRCAISGSRIYDFSKLFIGCRSLSLLDLTVSFYGSENEC